MDRSQILEKIEQIKIPDVNLEKLKEHFSKLTSKEIEVALDLFKNLDFYKLKIENLDLQNEEIIKSILLNLALKNEIKNIFEDDKKVEVELLKTLNSLDAEIKNKAIKAYITKGIHILKINNYDEFKYKILILKHFHDLGGFEIGLWGVKINFELFLNLINDIDDKLIDKLIRKKEILTRDSFIMLRNLFY